MDANESLQRIEAALTRFTSRPEVESLLVTSADGADVLAGNGILTAHSTQIAVFSELSRRLVRDKDPTDRLISVRVAGLDSELAITPAPTHVCAVLLNQPQNL